jgi:hypothetical protein
MEILETAAALERSLASVSHQVATSSGAATPSGIRMSFSSLTMCALSSVEADYLDWRRGERGRSTLTFTCLCQLRRSSIPA